MKPIRDILRNVENTSLTEIFNLFALVSLALFPLVYYMNRSAADSGFIFAFICLFTGVVLKMAQVAGWLSTFDIPIFFRHVKLIIFAVLSIFFLYPGYRLVGIPGAMIFLPGLLGIIFLCGCDKNKPIFFEDTDKYSFGRKDLYYIGALVLLSLFSIRKLLTNEPIVYYDWIGFGKGVLDSFPTSLTNPFVFFSSPLLLLIGNELTSNVFLLAWTPIASVTFYFFSVKILRNRSAAFVASFIYVFNPAVLDRFLSAHVNMLIGYATMPLILLLFVKSLKSQNYKTSFIYSLIAGVLFAISGSLANHFFYLNALLLVLYFILFSALNDPYKNLIKGAPLLVIVFLTGALLATPWLWSPVKLATSGYFSAAATLSYVESLSTQTFLYNNFRLIGQSGAPFIENIGYKSLSIWPLLGFLTVIIGFSALLLHRDRTERSVLIFSLITLVGIILSTGTMYMGELYRWLFINFPFFFAFREPSKFLVIAGFGLSMLAGITVDAVLSMRRNRLKLIVSLFLSVALLSQAIFAWPMLTGDNMLYSQHPRYIMTQEYRDMGTWIDSQDDAYKVIVLPYTGFTFHTWHLVSKNPVVLIDISSFSSLNSDIFQYSIFMIETLGREDAQGFSVLAGIKGVKYVVIQKDLDLKNIKETPDDYGYIPPFNRFDLSGQMLSKLLENSMEFKKIQEFGNYTVFENQKFVMRTGKEKSILAVGDRNLILEMAKQPNFELTKNELIFANKLTPDMLAELINDNTDLISNTDGNETTLALLDDEYKINVYDHAFPAGLGDNPRNIIYKKWIRSDIFEFLEGGVFGKGAVTYGRGYAITRGNAELIIPYSSSKEGHYQLWVRILYAAARGGLSVSLDDEKIMEISPESPDFMGFRWVKIGDVNLTNRIYNVKIINSNGENVIDQIAFIPGE